MDTFEDLTKAVRNHALKDAYAKAYEAGRELLTEDEIERHAEGIVKAFRKGVEKTRKAEEEKRREKQIDDLTKVLDDIGPEDMARVLSRALWGGPDWVSTPQGYDFWLRIAVEIRASVED